MTTAEWMLRGRKIPARTWLTAGAALLLALAAHRHLLDAIGFALLNLWRIAPVVLAGLLVTAVLTASGSIGLLVAAFEGRGRVAVVLVSLIGAVLPVCGITLLPLVAGLLGAGVPIAPIMAFLLSSAVTDPQMFAITAATLGLPFAVGKTAAAFGIGLLGGGAMLALGRSGWFDRPMRSRVLAGTLVAAPGGCGTQQVRWRFWRERARLAVFAQTCLGMAKLVLIMLGAAFVAEYFLKLYVPDAALASFVGTENAFAVPIAASVGAPLYLDGYAALPLVRGLIDRGMGEGAAMAFLIAGGITSAWTALPVFALVRLPVFAAYIALAVAGAMLSGWGYAIAVA